MAHAFGLRGGFFESRRAFNGNGKNGWFPEMHRQSVAGGPVEGVVHKVVNTGHTDETRAGPFWMRCRESCIQSGATGV
jgi:hypothetical protein